jgi:hypothetical protein
MAVAHNFSGRPLFTPQNVTALSRPRVAQIFCQGVPTCWPSKAVTHIFPSNHVQTSVPPSDLPHLVVPC